MLLLLWPTQNLIRWKSRLPQCIKKKDNELCSQICIFIIMVFWFIVHEFQISSETSFPQTETRLITHVLQYYYEIQHRVGRCRARGLTQTFSRGIFFPSPFSEERTHRHLSDTFMTLSWMSLGKLLLDCTSWEIICLKPLIPTPKVPDLIPVHMVRKQDSLLKRKRKKKGEIKWVISFSAHRHPS